jgi:peptidoglycan/xylan/chitin deacetylase (PgdA/CDA1 family)
MRISLLLSVLIPTIKAAQVYQNCVGDKVINLTFDDGPDVATEGILSILSKYNIKGTFFINGLKTMKKNKYELVKDIYNAGHIIATHGFSHAELTGLNTFNKRREFYDNELIIFRNLFNLRPYYIRCPYFSYNDAVQAIIDEFGYIIINASFESTDWINPNDPNTILNACKAQVDTGNNLLVLLHEHIMSNAIMLEEFILYAYSKNYTFVDTATCIGDSKTYNIENTYGPFLNNGVPGYT